METVPRRLRLDIYRDRLFHNLDLIKCKLADLRLLAVIKADAYHLGAQYIAPILRQSGVERFGVATLAEALELAPLGVPIQLLSAVMDDELPQAVANGFYLPVSDLETAKIIAKEGAKQRRRVKVQLALDSGMGRVGILPQDVLSVIPEIVKIPELEVTGLASHFPCATPEDEDTPQQIAYLVKVVNRLAELGITFEDVHIAASDGFCNYPDALKAPFTMARIGLDLYGCGPSKEMWPVMELKSKLASVRLMPAGSNIGYNRTCTIGDPTLVGTVAAGYADGVPLQLSNRGVMIVKGCPCPIIGRVSMDYTMIALDGVPNPTVGEEVTLWGEGNNFELGPRDWARMKDTHAHEVLCSLGQRLERRIIG